MEISFPKRDISKGPLDVLRHLYYHTAQYGQSVRQYTGESQKYWERLPDLLENIGDNRRKLDRIIKYLKKLAEQAPDRLKNRRIQIGRMDDEEDTVLQAKRRLMKTVVDTEELENILDDLRAVQDAIDQAVGTERHLSEGESEVSRILVHVAHKLDRGARNPGSRKAIVEKLEGAAEALHERIDATRSEIRGKWAEKEIVLSAQLVSVLTALPEELLALMFKRLTSPKDTPRGYRVVDFRLVKESHKGGSFVEPDLLLLGGTRPRRLLMVEMKTRGGAKSSHSYPLSQLLNYMRLAAECKGLEDDELPTKFAHLILVPTTNPKWLLRYPEWVEEVAGRNGGELSINPEACLKVGKYRGSVTRGRMLDAIRETPVYYHSWKQLANAYDSAVNEYGDERNSRHWDRIGDELEYLARRAGKYA